LKVRLLEGVRQVIAKSDSPDTLDQIQAVDKKISKALAKQRAAEEGVDAEEMKAVDTLDSKAEALKKAAAVAKSKYEEFSKDGSGADLVEQMRVLAEQAENKSAEAAAEADEARANMTATKPRTLGLSLSNITTMLSRNGTFVEDAGKRDSAKMIADAQKRVVAEALGDLDAPDTTLAALLKRVASSKNGEVAGAAQDIIDVQNMGKNKSAAPDCAGKECELKKENAALLARLAAAKADQDSKDASEADKDTPVGGAGIDSLLKPSTSQQLCTQKCLNEKCFPAWDIKNEDKVAETKSCISCSAKCKPECAKTVTSDERNALCNMNCNTRCCPSEELKGMREEWKQQESCRSTCTTQCSQTPA